MKAGTVSLGGTKNGRQFRLEENLALLFFFVLASYVAFHKTAFGGFLSDDFSFLEEVSKSPIVELFRIKPPTEASPGFFRPVAFIYWKLNYMFFGMNPSGYWHLSVLMHAVNGFLVFLLSKRLFGRYFAAVAAGLIFIAIPLQGEAVAWFSCAFDRLCLFFELAALNLYLCYLKDKKKSYYFMVFSGFILALFSKEMAVTFPALLVLMEGFSWDKNKDSISAAAKRLAPFFLALAAYIIFRYLLFNGIGGYVDASGKSVHVKADPVQIINAVYYLAGFFLLPVNRVIVENLKPFFIVFASLYILSIFIQKSSKELLRYTIFGLAWIFITLLPVINILPIFPDLNRGRFVYAPLVGFSILLAGLFNISIRPLTVRDYMKICLLSSLIAAYFYICTINYSTWQRAYDVARYIPGQVSKEFTAMPGGSRVYFIGVPDNIGGAFVYRNGLESAINLKYGYEGARRVKTGFVNGDGRLMDDPSLTYEQEIVKGGNIYVFWYDSAGTLITIYPS